MSQSDDRANDEHPECNDCPLAGRRAFVKHAGLATLGALIMVGMPSGLSAAAPTALRLRRWVGKNPSYPVPAKDGVQIDKENDVILVRWQNEIYAFNLSCPHQNTALRWNEGDSQFQCPKHHSKYKPDGTFISGRATRNMDRFSIARQGDEIVVNVEAMHKNDKDPSGWSASVVLLSKGA
ncbi:MAG: Rieske (2Fe-2S) protein [Gemmatimonadota bacterium]